MLDSLFQRPHHVRRLRANPLGAILDQFAEYLTPPRPYGLRRPPIPPRRGALRLLAGDPQRRRDSPDQVTKASVRQFLHEHLGDLLVPGSVPTRPHHEPGGGQPPAADARPAGPGPTGVAAGAA